MYCDVDHRWNKTILKQIISVFFMLFFSLQLYAADRGDFQLQRQITIGDGKNAYGKKIYGQGARAVMENVPIKGSTSSSVEQLIKRSIAADKPTALKVGGSMLKRLNSPQAIVGTAVVGGLLAAIGWIMEDGKYVKKIPDDDSFTHLKKVWCYSNSSITINCSSTLNAALEKTIISQKINKDKITMSEYLNETHYYLVANGSAYSILYINNPSYDPNSQPKIKTVPLTAALLGAAMVGSQYTDPDPKFDNTRVNTGDYTGVKDIYEHDPSGVGDELADAMDDKLRNAKPTGDGSPSFVGDPKYDNGALGNDRDDSSDRSWNEKGGAATGGSEPEKDPVTGQPTGNQSITLTFPLFCSWASKMCLWYDDWKASDKVYKDHMTKTEEHQTEEKTFWTSVKDWFDWTKDESNNNDDDNEPPDILPIPIGELDTSTFKATAGCPAPIQVPVDFGTRGNITISYEPICALAEKWSFIAPLIGFLSGAMILVGVGRKGEDGEI